MNSLQVALVAVVFVLAGVVKGVCGMGLPTVAISLLGLTMPPSQAAALLVLPSLATNVLQCFGPAFADLVKRLWPLWLGLTVAVLVSPALDGGAAATNAQRLLGGVLVLYGVWGLWRPTLPTVRDRRTGPILLVGAATGFLTAATAVFMLPMVPYLQVLRLDKDDMVQALGLSFTVATLALAIRLQGAGTLTMRPALAVLGLIAALAGVGLGRRLRSRLSQRTFERVLFALFAVLGAAHLWRSFF